jgi:hypothetical protein
MKLLISSRGPAATGDSQDRGSHVGHRNNTEARRSYAQTLQERVCKFLKPAHTMKKREADVQNEKCEQLDRSACQNGSQLQVAHLHEGDENKD